MEFAPVKLTKISLKEGLVRGLRVSLEMQSAALPIFTAKVNVIMENIHMIEDIEQLQRIADSLSMLEFAMRRFDDTVKRMKLLSKEIKVAI